MSSKHFIHDPTKLVLDSLQATIATNPSLGFQKDHKIIHRRLNSQHHGKVSIVTGGGSGHEPGFAGYVGKGFLTASVAGTIFASPSAEQVRQGLKHVPTDKGVFILIMNYTGDVLNFGMAAEDARAGNIEVELFAVGDDVGVGRQKSGKVGRRGLAGTVLVMKLCGALAEMGGSLAEVHQLARQVAANTATVGASLGHVHVPGRVALGEALSQNEIEIGMGIHNEPGSIRATKALPDLVDTMLQQLLDQTDPDRSYVSIQSCDRVVLLINNLGGVSALELGAITTEVVNQLQSRYGHRPLRIYSGPFLSSLNGPGFSITLLKLEDTGLGEEMSMLELLDFPAEALGWASPLPSSAWSAESGPTSGSEHVAASLKPSSGLTIDSGVTRRLVESGLHRLIGAEPEVTRYDTIVGDGDCGTGMKRGAEAILEALTYPSTTLDAVTFVSDIKAVVETAMDGTSGAIFTIFLSGLVQGLRQLDDNDPTPVDMSMWSSALTFALRTLNRYTPARPGDRTLMDALVPFVTSLATTLDVKQAAAEAATGAENTKALKPAFGRSVYVGSEDSWMGKIPDPGAWAVSEFFQGLAEAT
ncbi:dihydroxyacetone kinase [Plectosphaerella cucumerina]|uniref:Dihydroxyacetone kinase n=1 Tax=Plectosphaerella cucumerina TaxID=40658 RepID=A0A8K0X9A9_9PEZI|nr:dihydroxyacetone kinase [Plectosphaerella cucumerina]